MKAFKKWWEYLKQKELPNVCSPFGIDFAKLGWQAALKEVLKQISLAPDGSIVNWIEKELEGG